jgi:cell division septal protein FtsQ
MNSRPIYATLILLVFGLCVWIFFSQRPVEEIKVLLVKNEALHFYGPEDLKKLYRFVQDNPEAAVKNLSDLPFVEKAFLSRSLSGRSKIEVSLQQPIFALVSDEMYKLVNSKGDVFSEVPQYKVPNIPILTGQSFLVKKNRVKAVEILNKMPEVGVVSQESLSEVLFDGDLSFVFSGVDGKVYIGQEDIKKRVNRLTKVVKYLRYHGMSTSIIDARFKDKVIVSLSDKS